MARPETTNVYVIHLLLTLGILASLLFGVFGSDTVLKNSCDADPDKTKKLAVDLKTFSGCIKDLNKDGEFLHKPINCLNLNSLTKCLNTYIENVKECFPDEVVSWNQTAHAVQSVNDHFCTESNEHTIDPYGKSVTECFKETEFRECGKSLTILLLNPGDNIKDIEKLVLTDHECSNFTRAHDCMIQNLHENTNCVSPNVANITNTINNIIAKATGCETQKDGATDFLVSSTFIWILAISVAGLVTLTPS